VDMDIHGYIHVWISDFSHPVDIRVSMDIVLLHLLIKLNYLSVLSLYNIFGLSFLLFIFSFIYVIESNEYQRHQHVIILLS